MKKLLQKIIPYPLKLRLKLVQRYLQQRNLQYVYPETYALETIGSFNFILKQQIKEGSFHENKIHNLKIVGNKINNLIIQPNEVFSFWKLVGKPTAKNNFKKGRNLINGQISDDFGGGICQFSSILYHLALQTGFEIIERHPHSLDIYKEHERFTPLGADSTVVYGYKDLQFRNVCNFPRQFKCEINEKEIALSMFAQNKIVFKNIKFKYADFQNGVQVYTLVDDSILFKNFYIRQ